MADVGMGFSGAANLAGALDDLAEVSALCVPVSCIAATRTSETGPSQYEKRR